MNDGELKSATIDQLARQLDDAEIDELARRLAGKPSPDDRDHIVEVLMPVVSELAAIRAKRWFPRNPVKVEEFADDAPGFVLVMQIKHYRNDRGAFRTWCWRVFQNRLIDQIRSQSTSDGQPLTQSLDFYEESPITADLTKEPLSRIADRESLLAMSQKIRRALDDVADSKKLVSGQVDYFAAFLLKLRFEVARAAEYVFIDRHEQQGPEPFWRGVEQLIPWRDIERQRRVRTDSATLDEIWNVLISLVDEFEPGTMTRSSAVIHEAIGKASQSDVLAAATWDAWVSRAKRAVREELGEQRFNELFGWFCRSRERKGG